MRIGDNGAMAEPEAQVDAARAMLRHSLATLVYRCSKTLRGVPEEFAAFRAGETSRTPAEILAHIGDLLNWGLSIAQGRQTWSDTEPRSWGLEVERFFAAAEGFDSFLASDQALAAPPEKLFQGPIADALTHAGQLAMLRRLAGYPVRGENFFRAEIEAGRVGPDQAAPVREID
jgi:hypothetical protein